jgi:hypothetical protein
MTISKTSMQSPNMLVRSDSISSDITKILMINTPAGEDDVAGDGDAEEHRLTWMEDNSLRKSGAVTRRALSKNLIRPHSVQDRKDKGFRDCSPDRRCT